MKIFTLSRTTAIPASLEDVWAFFSSPKNLADITPPYMKFKITDFEDRPIYEGMLIQYKVRPILNIPLTWVTEITTVVEGRRFIDTQLRGPFRLWEHTHTFREDGGRVIMEDTVRYALPFGFLGLLAGKLFLHRQLAGIFNFREEVITREFGS